MAGMRRVDLQPGGMRSSSEGRDLVFLDFETSGLSPTCGDRPIEIGAVRIRNGRVAEEFQSLMNPGFRVNNFIQEYTGITNRMLEKAPPCDQVMAQFAEFVADSPLAAHNASFDSKFLDAELGSLGLQRKGEMVCTMLTSRRLFPAAPNHRLETLVAWLHIKPHGRAHRALADAYAAAALWQRMVDEAKDAYGVNSPTFDFMLKLSRMPKRAVSAFLASVGSGSE